MLRLAALLLALSTSLSIAGTQNYQCFYASGKTAIAGCTKALTSKKLLPIEKFSIFQRRGSLNMEAKYFRLAVRDYQLAIDTGFATPADFRELGIAQWWLNKLPEAETAIQEAVKRAPDNLLYKSDLVTLLHQMGKNEVALALLQSVLAENPFNADYLYKTGYQLNDMGRHEEALALLKKASVYDRENPEVWDELAYSHRRQKEFDAALQAQAKAINYDVKNPKHYRFRAEIYQDKGDYEAALADYDKALNLEKDGATYLLRASAHIELKHFDAARKDVGSARKKGIAENRALVMEGRIAYAEQEFAEANRKCEQAVKRDPTDAEASYWRGRARAALGKYKEAIADYKLSLVKWPVDTYTIVDLGNAQLADGQTKEAENSFRRAIALSPGYAYGLERLSLALVSLEKWDAAEEMADRAIAADSKRPDPYFHKAQAARRSSTPARGIEPITKYISMVPDKPWGYLERARVHISAKDYAAAFRDIEKSRKLDPQYNELPGVEAWRLSEMGDKQASVQILDAAIKQFPSDPWHHLSRGWIMLNLARPVDGMKDCEQAEDLVPSSAEPLRCQAHMLLRMERRSDAQHMLLRALDKNPDFGPAHFDLGRLAFEERDNDAVVKFMTKAIELQTFPDDALVYRADAYHAMGLPQAAKRDYELALKTAKKDLATYVGRRIAVLKDRFDQNLHAEYPQRTRWKH